MARGLVSRVRIATIALTVTLGPRHQPGGDPMGSTVHAARSPVFIFSFFEELQRIAPAEKD